MAQEIEETLETLAREGSKIRKISIVGYSMGGLVARYAIGLLHSRGQFDRLQAANFTTIASPHLGVRTPLKGYANQTWNMLGGRLLSTSGRQMFLIDSFRDTGRPLLSVLADPNSIFMRALALFSDRCFYANIINDRSAVYYTTAVSRTDPFADLSKVKLNYIPGYEPVVLDPDMPVRRQEGSELPTFYNKMVGKSQDLLQKWPLYVFFVIFIPIGSFAFLINSGVQTVRSQRRIRLHEQGASTGGYRVPLMIREMRQAAEDAFENVNAAQGNDYLPNGSKETANGHAKQSMAEITEKQDSAAGSQQRLVQTEFPTLALTGEQFAMIESLEKVGFRRYPVHIHKSHHSHAAIIVRRKGKAFEEGHTVIDHWVNEEFKI